MPQMPTIIVQLVHLQGPLKGQIQDFFEFPVHIGRHSSCHVRFDKDLTTISRRHARIERQGNRFRIIDASTNGTFINGKRIADVYLRDGDVITFAENGPKASFLTKLASATAPDHRSPSTQPAAPQQQPPPAAPPVAQPTAPPAPSKRQALPEPGLTASPDLDIPVISTSAPLVIQFGPTLRSFDMLPVTIGTDPACDFVIAGDALAGRHVQIFFSDDEYYTKDLTGKSMVTINGRPVGTQMVLAQGAELSLTDRGPKLKFLGGGRLAEIPQPEPEALAKTDIDPNLQGADSGVPKAKKGKKANSRIKNFFS